MIDVDVTLSVADGTRRFDLSARFVTDVPFAALYGPSGSGKSLTLQAIAGLLHPSSGHVRLDGRTLFDSTARIDVPAPDRRIGYLFQNYALFPHLSVRQNVAFGLTSWRRRRLSQEDHTQVDALLDGFDLRSMADSKPRTLSGGQQQRVALARALACKPQVLLLDEPFAALNPMLRGTVRKDLAEMRERWGIPVIMITHDVEDVLELADVAYVYRGGQIVQEVDLRQGVSHDVALRQLGVDAAPSESALRKRLRRMLDPSRP